MAFFSVYIFVVFSYSFLWFFSGFCYFLLLVFVCKLLDSLFECNVILMFPFAVSLLFSLLGACLRTFWILEFVYLVRLGNERCVR